MFQFKQISQTFGQKKIAQQIDLSIEKGNMLAILGASGSGKSTLLNIAAGLQTPDAGEVWLNGENITDRQPEKRGIAMMFQDFALLPHLNVWQNVAFGLFLRHEKRAKAREKAIKILEEVGLVQAANRQINQLSGGEQQRVALARALIIEPKLLLLDEPFSSLDTHLRQQLQQQINHFIQIKNIPTILVSHDPAEAALCAQTIALLADGKIIQTGTPAELFTRPVSAQAAHLLGCLNVSENHFVPPSAISLAENDGELCRVLSCFRQPAFWRVVLQHPKWGELVYFSEQEQSDMIRLKIDEQAVVAFQAA